MSFVNPVYYKLQKLDKKNVQNDDIETLEDTNEVEKKNIISLDEIMNEIKVEIDYIDFPKSIYLTSGPRSLSMNPNELAKLSIDYSNASTKNDSISI